MKLLSATVLVLFASSASAEIATYYPDQNCTGNPMANFLVAPAPSEKLVCKLLSGNGDIRAFYSVRIGSLCLNRYPTNSDPLNCNRF